MSHLKKLKETVERQSKLIFGHGERRKNRPKRQFTDSIIDGQTATKNRELAAEIVTYTIIRFKEYYHELKKDKTYGVSDYYRILFED